MNETIKNAVELFRAGKDATAAAMLKSIGVSGMTIEGMQFEICDSYCKVVDCDGLEKWLSGLGLKWLDSVLISSWISEVRMYSGNRDRRDNLRVCIEDMDACLMKSGVSKIPSKYISIDCRPYFRLVNAELAA